MAGIHFLVCFGAIPILVGGCMAAWPAAMCELTLGSDDRPIPPTPANVRWMRMAGVALLVLGGVCVWAGLAGVKGDPDPVLC